MAEQQVAVACSRRFGWRSCSFVVASVGSVDTGFVGLGSTATAILGATLHLQARFPIHRHGVS